MYQTSLFMYISYRTRVITDCHHHFSSFISLIAVNKQTLRCNTCVILMDARASLLALEENNMKRKK